VGETFFEISFSELADFLQIRLSKVRFCLCRKYVLLFVGLFEESRLRAIGGTSFVPNVQTTGTAAAGPRGQRPLMHGYQAAADAQRAIDQAVEGPAAGGTGLGVVLAGQLGQHSEGHNGVQGRGFGDGDLRGAGSRGF
jgi:hypothetical protein